LKSKEEIKQEIKKLTEIYNDMKDASIGEFYTYDDRMEDEKIMISRIYTLEWVLGEWD
jgi:hypothetical protein